MSASINTIPASVTVNIIPGVLSAGGNALDLIELMLTTNTRVPIGEVLSFPNQQAVASFFGGTSFEASEASVYFQGFDNSTAKPGALLFTQYPTGNVGAYLRGGNVSGLTLTQLQALTGVLTVTIDGSPHTSSSINLSSATSFSAAAETITTALGLTGPTQATATGSMGATFTATATGTSLVVTGIAGVIHPGSLASATVTGTGMTAGTFITVQVSGTTGGNGTYTLNQSSTSSGASITCTSTTLDIPGSPATGTIQVGQEVTGVGITAGTFITALGTGTGGAGTYITTTGQEVASESLTFVMPTVTYDSVSGAFVVVSSTTGASSTISYGSGTIAGGLALTQATGAVLSQGAIAGVPSSFMNNVLLFTNDWVSFQTLFDPDNGSGNTQKQLFAAWCNSQNNRFVYLAWDTDITPTESTAATSSLGYILENVLQSSGTVPIYEAGGETANQLAAYLGGAIASVDFTATNGRTNFKFRTQTGLTPSVTNATVAANLDANGYNYLGANATANQKFIFWAQGSVTGPFEWLDSYVNQIWLNNALQLALMECLTQNKALPYNPRGYGIIRAYCQDPINAAVNFGAIVPNVPLSQGQIANVNNAAGMAIDGILSTRGWYLQILAAQAIVRGQRQSPPINLWYMDGGSVNQIKLASTLIQ